MDKAPDANEILMRLGPNGLRKASDTAKAMTAEDLALGTTPSTAIGAIGTNGSGANGDWDNPDLSLLAGPAIPPPRFPVQVLGPYWANWCSVAAKGSNAPIDYVATALLATGAALIGNARRVAASNWEEPAVLWAMLVGVPSAGKSPALDPLSRILGSFEAEMAREYEQELLAYTADLEASEQRKDQWKDSVKAAIEAGEDRPDLPADAQKPLPPPRPRIVIADTTMEAAAEIAGANPKGLIVLRDELAGWWRSFNRYGGDGERQFWLHAHGGRRHTVDRKKLGKPITIPQLSISVIGGTQPDVLTKLIEGEEDGFASRFLYCFPDPVSGFTLSTQSIEYDGAKANLQRLRDLAMVDDDQTGPTPIVCSLDPEAAKAFEKWWTERLAEAGHHTGPFGAWLGKAGGLALRLALVLEHLWWSAWAANSVNSASDSPDQIGLIAIQWATRLLDQWATPMAQRAFGMAAISHAEADAAALAGWLKRNCCPTFNSRDLRRTAGGPSGRLRKAENMAAGCKLLLEAGLIRLAGMRAGHTSGRTRLDFEVNPLLHSFE